ncbi:hypothetical protein [Psychroserpens sp. Hel_I_66]|uniref:hypothetical protein n=1 Tax=Psychroserpens sp. Hel_I_66 TaxID=1250004 RepID=UPI0006465625|nr:hypothetical protein [Psychroserpens sp. Hel_I_66]
MKTLLLIALILISPLCFSQVGIGTSTPKSTLDINGNLSLKVVDYNGGPSMSATPIDDGIYINLRPTTGNLEFILPDAATVPGRIYIMRNVDDVLTAKIYSFGGLFFPGDSRTGLTVVDMESDPNTDITINTPSKTITFISDGANWTFGYFMRLN